MTDAAKKIDAYITKAPEFAQPVLERFRKAAHRASPDIEETIKWGLPCFEYQGLVAGMGAYKQHVALNFWRGMLIPDPDKLFAQVGNNEMAAIKVASVKEMPTQAVLVRYLKAAIKLNVAQAKTRQAAKKNRRTEDHYQAVRQEEDDEARYRPGGLRDRPRPQEESPNHLRRIQLHLSQGIRRVDHRCETRRDSQAAHQTSRRMARRRQTAELEIHELLTPL
jgi:hypothetical protein